MIRIVLVWALILLGTLCLTASRTAAEEQGGAGLRAAAQNPVGAMYSLPFKFTFDNGASNGAAGFLNIQPVIPVTVGGWNIINRAIIPIISAPGGIGGLPDIPGTSAAGDRKTGLGDINYSPYLSPARPGRFIWGVGPSLSLPTATSLQLGSGKWSAGPTGVLLMQPKPWTIGILARQLWSFAGQSNRASVSQFLLEPFVNYNLSDGWYLLTDMVVTANWHESSGEVWTLPVGGGAGKLFQLGGQAINARVESYYNAVRPSSGPEWNIGFTIQFLFPR